MVENGCIIAGLHLKSSLEIKKNSVCAIIRLGIQSIPTQKVVDSGLIATGLGQLKELSLKATQHLGYWRILGRTLNGTNKQKTQTGESS